MFCNVEISLKFNHNNFLLSICKPEREEAAYYSWHGSLENPDSRDRAHSVWFHCLFCLQGDDVFTKLL